MGVQMGAFNIYTLGGKMTTGKDTCVVIDPSSWSQLTIDQKANNY